MSLSRDRTAPPKPGRAHERRQWVALPIVGSASSAGPVDNWPVAGETSRVELRPLVRRDPASPGAAPENVGTERHGPGRPGLGRPGLVGLVGAASMATGGSLARSPFVLEHAGEWFFGSATASPREGFDPLGVALSAAGFVLVSLAWFDLLARLRRAPGRRPVELLPLAAAWVLPFLVVAPQLSHDPYLYAAEGQLLVTGHNPTLVGVVALPAAPYRRLVDPVWLRTPSPYGPLFTWLEGVAVVLAAHRVLWTVVLIRLEALGGVALGAISLPSIARSCGRDAASAVAIGALSPLVVLYLVSPAHNDALIAGLVLAAVALASRGQHLAAVVVAGLAAAIKVPALGATLFLGWTWPIAPAPRPRRAGAALGSLGIGLAVLEVASLATGLGWHWVSALSVTVKGWNFLDPVDSLVTLLRGAGQLLGAQVPFATAFGEVSVVAATAGAVACTWLLLKADRLGLPAALGGALLVVALAAPALHVWYLSWGIMLLAGSVGSRGSFWLAWFATLFGLPIPRTAEASALLAAAIAVATVAVLAQRRYTEHRRDRPSPEPAPLSPPA